jgi:pyrroloquinoline-quinone synthase
VDLFERMDLVRERWDVLRHPFYRRWSEGGLEHDEISFYAGEYRHAVVALAEAAAAAACGTDGELREELERHAAEEQAHVGLWDEFARALEARLDRQPLAQTATCAEAWTAGEDLLERLAILYAVESTQPAISQTKLQGLVRYYGMTGTPRATAYFALHAERDHEHAGHSRRVIAERLEDVDADRLVGRAGAALEGNWRLLDGVEGHLAEAAA